MTKKIIIADDEAINRNALKRQIRRLFSENVPQIREVDNGWDLVKSVFEEMPDLIITDNNMPNLDGVDAVKPIRFYAPTVPIILMSGYYSIRTEALHAGASAFLEKPYDQDVLARLLKTYLA